MTVTPASEPPELVIIETPINKKDITKLNPPTMPLGAIAKVQYKNFTGGAVQFKWTLTVKWKRPDHDKDGNDIQTSGVYNETDEGQNSDIVTIPLFKTQDIIRGGDDLRLYVFAVVDGVVVKEAIQDVAFQVVGLNPSKTDVKALLTLEQQVIAYWESGRTFHQFKADQDYPLYGYPHGFGIMQVDPPTDDAQIWDWTKNIAEGKKRYADKARWAANYHNFLKTGNRDNGGHFLHPLHRTQRLWYIDLRTRKPIKYQADALTQEQQLLDTYQLYNGGAYWKWVLYNEREPEGSGKWVAAPNSNYADNLKAIYDNVKNGIYPSGWNDN